MKNLKILFTILLISNHLFSQETEDKTVESLTSKGSVLLEINTGLGGAHLSDTGIRFSSQGDLKYWNFGFEGGYFIIDNLSIKAGLGYGHIDSDISTTTFSYKVGAKYYLLGKVPISINYSGASVKREWDVLLQSNDPIVGDYDTTQNPKLIDFSLGYAFFLGKKIAIEPGLNYALSLDKEVVENNIFRVNIGCVLFL
jgi:hypothetical protein